MTGGTLRGMWEPAHVTHAIQNAYAALVFNGPPVEFDDARLAGVRDAASALGMDRDQPTSAFTINFETGNPVTAVNENTGHRFWREEGGRVLLQLLLEPSSIRLDTFSYTRWIGFRAELEMVVERVASIFYNATVERVALEYTDVFTAIEGRGDTSLVIDDTSGFRPAAVDPQGFWHRHTGWFEDQGQGLRLLVNVDATSSEVSNGQETRHLLVVRTHEALVHEPPAPFDGGVALDALDGMHNSLKQRLKNVLTQEARDMIALGEK